MGEFAFLFGRRLLFIVVISIALAGQAFAASRTLEPVAPGASGKTGGPPGLNSHPVLADRDGDRMADGLASMLESVGAGDQINVIVLMDPSGTVGKAKKGVGVFKVRHNYSLINGFSATVNAGQARALSKMPFVERVEPVYTVRANLEAAGTDTGVDQMRAFAAVASATYGRGAGTTICVVDTGIQHDHEVFVDLATGISKITNGYFAITGAGPVGPTTDMNLLFDGNGHGTHVASIAAGDGDGDGDADDGFAAAMPGMAPDADILPVKVLNSNGTGSDDDVQAGVEWCAQHPDVDVINLSISGDAQQSDGLDSMSQIVNAAVQAGKVVIAGAGNSDYPGDIRPPAAAHLAVSVGAYGEWSESPELLAAAIAIDQAQGGTAQQDAIRSFYSKGPYTAWFSTRGTTSDGRILPDVVAPGHSVIAATSKAVAPCDKACYISLDGTSMATPMVSGIAALIIAAKPDLNPDQVRQIIFDTAQHRGPTDGGGDPLKSRHWGFGLVDAHAAVSMARVMAGDHALDPSQTLFPSNYQIGEGSVDRGDSTSINFSVTDTSTPLTVMLTAPESATVECYLLYVILQVCEVRPDLDIFLYKVNGGSEIEVANSQCPGIGEFCNYEIQYGMQETIAIKNPSAGSYRLEVRFLNATATPPDLQNSSFTYQISQGPLAIASNSHVANTPPVAVAGDDYTTSGPLVTLDGSSSSDSGGIKLYAWQWSIAGGDDDGVVGSSNAKTPTLGFNVAAGGIVSAKLTVVDNLGASASDEVVISVGVSPPNNPPIADAGGNYTVKLPKGRGATASITLDGSGSSDPDGDNLSFSWVEVGTSSELSPTDSLFVSGLTRGTYYYELTVDDGNSGTDSAIACVEVHKGKNPEGLCSVPSGPTPPVASFSHSCTDLVCTFTDTSSQTDGDPITSWSWSFDGTGSSSTQNPSHTFPEANTYTVQLTATDKDGSDVVSQNVTVNIGGAPIALSSTGSKVKGVKVINLTWSGATNSDFVDIYRDGSLILETTENDGSEPDNTGQKGGGSHTSQVCEAGSITVCSDVITTIF